MIHTVVRNMAKQWLIIMVERWLNKSSRSIGRIGFAGREASVSAMARNKPSYAKQVHGEMPIEHLGEL